MRFVMHPRVPAALATSVLVAGCVLGAPPNGVTPGGGKKAPATYEGKVKKVDALTKAFSLESNDGLKRASTSIQRLVQALASLSAMNAPQAMPASSAGAMRYQLRRIASDLTDAGAEATYELAGIERNGPLTLVYDDETREVTGIVGPDAEIALKFVNGGRRRSYEATILRSPDGTTGSFFIEVEGGWTSFPSPPTAYYPPPMASCETPEPYDGAQPSAAPYPYPSIAPYPYRSVAPFPYGSSQPYPGPNDMPMPIPGGSYAPYPQPPAQPPASGSYPPPPAPGWYSPPPSPRPSAYAVQQAGGWFGGPQAATPPDPGYEQGYAPPYDDQGGYGCPQPEWTPPPPPSPLPYKFLGGEYPNLVTSIKVKLDVVPQGDKALAFQMEGTFDEPESIPFYSGSTQVPTHWVYKARVPKVRLDWESHMHLDQGKSTFKGGGTLNVEGGPDGDDTFEYALTFDEAKRHGAFSLTHVDAKVKLLLEGDPSRGNDGFRSVVVSTEDNSEIGTLEPDSSRPGWAIIKLKKDNKRIDWQLVPSNLLPQPAMAPAIAGPAPVGPRPVAVRPKPASTPRVAPQPARAE